MTFAPIIHPLALLLLLALPLAFFCYAQKQRPYEEKKTKTAEIAVASAACLLLFIIGLRPGYYEATEVDDLSASRNVDVLFVVDTTLSMWADDGEDSKLRFDNAREDCQRIMEKLEGADFALMRFDNTARLMAPFTQDTESILETFDVIERPDSYSAKGTDLTSVEKVLHDFLEKMSEKRSDDIVVFVMSDGEVTNPSSSELSFADCRDFISGGAVIGYGTAQGGKMADTYGAVTDWSTGQVGISKIDEEALRKMADELGVEYTHTSDDGKIDSIVGGIADKSTFSNGTKHIKGHRFVELYWIIVPVLMAAIVAELVLVVRRRKTEVLS